MFISTSHQLSVNHWRWQAVKRQCVLSRVTCHRCLDSISFGAEWRQDGTRFALNGAVRPWASRSDRAPTQHRPTRARSHPSAAPAIPSTVAATRSFTAAAARSIDVFPTITSTSRFTRRTMPSCTYGTPCFSHTA